jgi:DNA polymerase-3 subunit epsilon
MTKLRQIVLDTETTGIGHEQGHRIIEIGCIELYDRRLTGKHFHCYLNPERAVDDGAFKVHGLSNAFLADKPLFKDIKQSFIDFIRDAEVIIHNATFDVGFINAELARLRPLSKMEDFCSILDSLDVARRKHPGQRNSLDALCKRYQVDATDRVFHGALLDAQLLADVYLAMTSGQKKIEFSDSVSAAELKEGFKRLISSSPIIQADTSESQAHSVFLDIIKKKTNTIIWDSYEPREG